MGRSSNKTIAYNTLLLYVRMVITMGVSFFTVRIVLNALGAEDYGINNAVGGFISILSFLSNSLAGASQRFLSFQLGKDTEDGFLKFFNLSIWAYLVLSIIIFLLCETVGLWFFHHKMQIPEARMMAAGWIYQSTIVCFILSILTTPYIASIFSFEKMDVYAYVSIVEALLKLLMAYVLVVINSDKLIAYAILLVVSQAVISICYMLYARMNFKNCRFIAYWDKKEMIEILSFTGWTLFGSLAAALKGQGVNVLLNVFFNPIVNAARGIAFSLQTLVNGLRVNFYNAVAPQLTKRYASNEMNKMHELLFMSSKLAFYLVLYLAIPVLVVPDVILGIWLVDYPPYSVVFTQLVVLDLLLDMYTNPLTTAINASGKIRGYQLWFSSVTILIIPLTYFLLMTYSKPEVAFYATMGITLLSYIPTFYFARKTIGLDVKRFLVDVAFPCFLVFILTLGMVSLINSHINNNNLLHLLLVFGMTIIILTCVIFLLGLNKIERGVIKSFINSYIARSNG